MLFLMDENSRPLPEDLKLWVDCIRFIKRGSPGGALSFFTYMELSEYIQRLDVYEARLTCFIAIWVVTFLFFRPERLRWSVLPPPPVALPILSYLSSLSIGLLSFCLDGGYTDLLFATTDFFAKHECKP